MLQRYVGTLVGIAIASMLEITPMERAMPRVAQSLKRYEDADELGNDRLPGMPLVGFLTGTILSLAIWAGLAMLAWAT
jgi:hypothetical protein